MKRLIEYQVQGAQSVFVEVDQLEGGEAGLAPAGRPGDLVTKACETLDATLGRLVPIIESVGEKLRGLAASPDQVEIEFGIKLGGGTNLIIASSDAEANLGLRMTWTLKKASES